MIKITKHANANVQKYLNLAKNFLHKFTYAHVF